MEDTKIRQENRCKTAFVSARTIARFFDAADIPHDSIEVPRFKDLPKGYEVRSVYFDHMRQGFVFLLYHPSWPVLGETAYVPEAYGGFIRDTERVRLARAEPRAVTVAHDDAGKPIMLDDVRANPGLLAEVKKRQTRSEHEAMMEFFKK